MTFKFFTWDTEGIEVPLSKMTNTAVKGEGGEAVGARAGPGVGQ